MLARYTKILEADFRKAVAPSPAWRFAAETVGSAIAILFFFAVGVILDGLFFDSFSRDAIAGS